MGALRNLKQADQAAAANVEGFFLQGYGGVVVQDVEEVACADVFPFAIFAAFGGRDAACVDSIYGKS